MSDRTCVECGEDIGNRHWRSKRCSPCQLQRERQAMNVKPKTLYPAECAVCAVAFMTPNKKQITCSRVCGGRAGHLRATRTCIVCDASFTVSLQFDRDTCSRSCGAWNKAHPDRKPIRECRWCGKSLADKMLDAEWCDDRCWHGQRQGVSWEWIKNRKCVICGQPMPQSMHYHRVVCSASCRTRNRSVEVLFRQTHARRRNMDAAKVYRVPKSYIRRLRQLPCYYCGKSGGTADHVVPISRGGKHSEGNLVPACRSCNSSKADRFVMEWRLRKGGDATWPISALVMAATSSRTTGRRTLAV